SAHSKDYRDRVRRGSGETGRAAQKWRGLFRTKTMAIKTYRPVTPTLRFKTTQVNDDITTSSPHKPLLTTRKRTGGRRNSGDLTIRHHGGGHKQKIRLIDFKRDKSGVPGKVATIEYDPNRSARIALVHYADGEKRYIIAPVGLKIGATVSSGPDAD